MSFVICLHVYFIFVLSFLLFYFYYLLFYFIIDELEVHVGPILFGPFLGPTKALSSRSISAQGQSAQATLGPIGTNPGMFAHEQNASSCSPFPHAKIGTHSFPEGRPSFSPSTPSALPIMELLSIHSSESEVRDVQVDERVTMTRWSKKHRA